MRLRSSIVDPLRLNWRLGEGRLGRLGYIHVSLPTLVLEFDVLDRNRIRVCVQVGNGLIFRHPAAEDLVGDRELTCFVVELDDDVLAKILKRHLSSKSSVEVPYFVSPLLKLGVVSYAPLQSYRFELGSTRRFSSA